MWYKCELYIASVVLDLHAFRHEESEKYSAIEIYESYIFPQKYFK